MKMKRKSIITSNEKYVFKTYCDNNETIVYKDKCFQCIIETLKEAKLIFN